MCYRNWVRALSIVTRQQARQLRYGDSILSIDKKCFFPPGQPAWPWACPASYSMGTRGSFCQHRQLGHETEHSPPPRAENECNYTSTAQYAFMVSTKPNVPSQSLLHYDILCYFTKIISSRKM
jgi:hypothetical protein